MRLLRFGVIWGVVFILGSGGTFTLSENAFAQGGDQCAALAGQAIAEAEVFCGDLLRGDVCIGHAVVTVQATGEAAPAIANAGDRLALSTIDALITLPAAPDAGDWGLAVLKLPASPAQAVTAVLLGDARMARPPQAEAERPAVTVYNRGGAAINLRNGAAITYDVVGQLAPGEEALADGRNEQGDWVRIQFSGGIAWVFTPLIGWDGDPDALNALEVLLPNDVTPVVQPAEPFAAFTLTSNAAACSAAPSGLLLQGSAGEPATLQVNQVTLEFADATLFVTAAPGGAMDIRVLDGTVTVTARGIPNEVGAGQAARVSLGGSDGLTPLTAPDVLPSFAFLEVAYAPFSLLPDAIDCMVGNPAAQAIVPLRVGPGEQRGIVGDIASNAIYTVIGWASDPNGAPWWQLDTGEQPSWASQADVRAIGACELVAQVEPPPLVLGPAVSAPAGGEGSGGVEVDFAPAANSVWQMRPGADNLIGQCSGAPAINFCDHLAAISPAPGGIAWKGMEASPYFLTRVQPNVYSYSGPNVLGTGSVVMTLAFTSENTLNMTMSMVLNSEPDCQHVYYYTGTRNW